MKKILEVAKYLSEQKYDDERATFKFERNQKVKIIH